MLCELCVVMERSEEAVTNDFIMPPAPLKETIEGLGLGLWVTILLARDNYWARLILFCSIANHTFHLCHQLVSAEYHQLLFLLNQPEAIF